MLFLKRIPGVSVWLSLETRVCSVKHILSSSSLLLSQLVSHLEMMPGLSFRPLSTFQNAQLAGKNPRPQTQVCKK